MSAFQTKPISYIDFQTTCTDHNITALFKQHALITILQLYLLSNVHKETMSS